MTDSLTTSTPRDTPEPAAPVYRYYAGGEWKDAASGQTFDSYEPYTGRVFARVAAGGTYEMGDAIDAAHAAFPAWAATPAAVKAALLLKAAEIVKRRSDEIADKLARETGSTLPFSQFQQGLVADTLQQAAGGRHSAGKLDDTDLPPRRDTPTGRSPISPAQGVPQA